MDWPWIDKALQQPTKADADPAGCVIVWHLYQGVMLCGWHTAVENRFMTHWMPPPERPKDLDRSRYE